MKRLVINGKTISEHLKAFLEAFKRKMSETWEWIKEHKTAILIFLGTVIGLGLGALALSHDSDSEGLLLEEDDSFEFEAKDYNTYGPQDYEPVVYKEPRYRVEMRAFKTGEWYTKTPTDSIGAAYSVAKTSHWGRASRIIDQETGEIIFEKPEDPGMKDANEAAHYDLIGARSDCYSRHNSSFDVDDAALIWASNGKDEDYTFGYTEEELEEAFNS